MMAACLSSSFGGSLACILALTLTLTLTSLASLHACILSEGLECGSGVVVGCGSCWKCVDVAGPTHAAALRVSQGRRTMGTPTGTPARREPNFFWLFGYIPTGPGIHSFDSLPLKRGENVPY